MRQRATARRMSLMEFVLLDAVSGPLEFALLSLLLGLWDGYEVAGDAARVYDTVGDAVFSSK
jgi:hypothetical protein